MTDDQLKETWAFITSIARTAQLMPVKDLEALSDVIAQSHALGPIIDPTKYRDEGIDNLHEQEVLLKGFLAFRRAIEQVKQFGTERRR